MKISLARMYYPVKVLGPGSRVGIWLNGCPRRCEGCISPEMQLYDPSKEIPTAELIRMLARIKAPIDGFTISGGEPFYRPEALESLVLALETISDDILIFTGYTLEELAAMDDPSVNSVLSHCACLVDGPFIRELNGCRGLRGSSNQRCRVFRHHERYSDIETAECRLQTVMRGSEILTLGIPQGDKL